ncbi:MAG: glycosyltransferase family 39 protein [Bacteroidales bacterium]|nr:glycosyltransferase family 39 protein [Bacteroidales bacterium]
MDIKQHFKNPNFLLIGLLLAWWIVNLFQAALTDLDVDETYYWVYSNHLAWGYFDHPPFIAWLIRMGTVIFGKTTLGVRFFVTLLQPISLYLFWRLLRSSEATVKEAALYFLLCASIPVLQVYGFVATPDAPLMFSAVLFLTAYRSFIKKNTWLTACFTGVTIAMLMYSKYHGVLVFSLVMLPDILKLLRNPRFYFIALLSVVLLMPHFLWLYDHDFASIRFHILERGQGKFVAFNLIEYFYNTILCYHPFLFLLFIVALIRRKPADSFERSLYFMTIGFYLFFLFSIRKTATQPQWLLPTALSICFILFQYVKNKPKLIKAVFITAYISIVAYMAARVLLVVGCSTQANFLFFQERENNRRISQAVGDHPVVFRPHYVPPSVYMFYNEGLATTQLNIDSRSNQYAFLDYDDKMAGKTVAVESRTGAHAVPLLEGRFFKFDYYENYLPVRRMKAEFLNLPKILTAREQITLKVELTNPYNYDIFIGNEKTMARIHFVLKQNRDVVYDVVPQINSATVKAGASVIFEMNIEVPDDLLGISDAHICVQQPGLFYASNNVVPRKVKIIKNE